MVLSVQRLLSLPIVWLLVVVVLLLIRRKVLRAAKASPLDRRIVSFLARLYLLAGLLACAYFTLEIVPLPQRWEGQAEKALTALSALFAVWVAWRGLSLLLSHWGETNPNAGTLIPPVQFVGRLLFAIVGVALILNGLGYSLTKVWTALGIGSVAIALALQDTLSNTFAGFYIMLDQPIRVADYVKLDSGEEGRVTRIGWRSTWLRTLSNNVVVLSNSKLSRASVVNYSLPDPDVSLSIPVNVSYASEPRRVRAVLQEVAQQAAGEVEGLLADPPPSVSFIPGFGEYSLNFSLNCRVRDYPAQFAVQDELRYRIFERFRREGLEMAMPARRLKAVTSDE